MAAFYQIVGWGISGAGATLIFLQEVGWWISPESSPEWLPIVMILVGHFFWLRGDVLKILDRMDD